MTTLHAVELGVLGPLQVRLGGAPVAIPGTKPRAILTMLGLHAGSVVRADTLIELLWGEDPPRTAAKALQTHISSLRRALGDGVVVTEGSGWTLAGADVDASRFKAAARAGRDAAASGDSSQAVTRFDEGLALWRGMPELPDGQRGSSEKTRWIEASAALAEDRADALLATGRAAEIIGELEAAVADAPLRERRWGQLILALYRAGRQGEALGAYQRARSLLADQLGVDPGPELRRLEAAVVAQDATLDMPVAQNISSVTRAVTFLLTDIEGSTAAWEADAEAMAVALARHDEVIEHIVTARGGRLIKTRGEGDATFSVFERPSSAAAAAIELQEAINHEPWTLRESMRIRVALHTGEVELRDGDYFGRAVNRAARLRSLASGGQILCSGATAELVIDSLPDDVALADLGMRQLRNLARPEHVFELRLENTDDSARGGTADAAFERPELPAVLGGPGPFVGRGRELARLLTAWQMALAGNLGAVLIAGEPGVGKTRLAGEWSLQAYGQGAVVLYGRCDEDLGAPYQPFAEAVRSLVPSLGESRLRGLRGMESLLSLAPGLSDVLPDLAAPAWADPETERYALFDAVVALLRVASDNAPVVLILDDLHWAAKPTLLLLRHLLRFGERARVQIVGTYRSTDLDRSHPLAAMLADLHRDGTAERLQLGGLDENDVTAYVAEAGYDDEELARALASVTGGNPFFLIEALRHVDESGGVWDQSTLPQGVREAVSRRLSRLPAETNKALAAAAVVGSRFAVELVERVVDQDLVDAFDEACKAGIVIEEPGGRYRFNHALVRQSLLAELPSVRRMRLHQRIATTLESEHGGGDEFVSELAYHYFECAWAGNADKAVEYCRRAADQAMARLAYEGAADLYDRALHALEEIDDELPDRDDQTTELLVARCEALLAAGDVATAAGAVAQLQEAARGSARVTAWATCFDGQLSMLIDPERLDDIEVAVGAAAATLAELDDAAGEAKAHTVRAGCLTRLGRIGDGEIALDHALTAARRAGEHRRVNAVLAGAPLAALWGPNPVPRAGGRCLDVVRLLRITTDSPAVEATSTRCQAVLEAFRGRTAAARRMIDSARRTVTELGLRHALLEVAQFAGIVELVADEPGAAEPHLRRAYDGFRRMGLDADTAETAALLGRACLALDRDDEADDLCSQSERLAGHGLKASIAWRTLRAQLLSRRGQHADARRVAESAVRLAERTDALVEHGDACSTLAAVLGAAGDAAGMRAAAERAAELYERKGATALADTARATIGTPAVASAPVGAVGGIDAAPDELNALRAEFEYTQPKRRRLENAATRAGDQVGALFADRRWDEISALYSDVLQVEDRRRGLRRESTDKATEVANLRAVAATGVARISSTALGLRGDRLCLSQIKFQGLNDSPEAFRTETLAITEVDERGLIAATIAFDPDDITAAFAELDARYLTGDAADYADTWSVIMHAQAALNQRHELPPTTPDWVNLDHRRAIGFAAGDMTTYIRALWNSEPDVGAYIEAVHQLDDLGAVFVQVLKGSSADGFDAEWRALELMTVEGDLINRAEIFDEADIDAALARFHELHPRVRTLENAASRAAKSYLAHFAARDWDGMGELLAHDAAVDDRRTTVNIGVQHGRDVEIAEWRAAAAAGFTDARADVIAIRGERVSLVHATVWNRDERSAAFRLEAMHVIETDTEGRIAAAVAFDADDIVAAFDELDARYLAGEAAAHAHIWSVITKAIRMVNRREIPSDIDDFTDVDHRPLAMVGPGELLASLRAAMDIVPDLTIQVEAVHRLTNRGAVLTYFGDGSTRDGFAAEWRSIGVYIVEGDRFERAEVFDEADVDRALARFDQLDAPSPRLENTASRVLEQYLARFATRDWDAMAEALAVDIATDDRRRVVSAGVRSGRDGEIANVRVIADLGCLNISSTPIATRGERLVLARHSFTVHDQLEPFQNEMIDVVEINADDQIATQVVFDADDIDAAFDELDARYLVGEAAPHARTWTAVEQIYASLNRDELPATTSDWVNIDHRRGSLIAPGDIFENVRATWDLASNISRRAVAVHRLNRRGAVLSHTANGTSHQGTDIEWRLVMFLTLDGDLMNHCELFDESDLDAALAKFDELEDAARHLENAASEVYERFWTCYAARDWVAAAEMLSVDHVTDDRRRVVGAGVRHGRAAMIDDLQLAATQLGILKMALAVIATRGSHLFLGYARYSGPDQRREAFYTDVLTVVETDADDRIATYVLLDSDDIDAAFDELDARYLAGEAANHARTWSVIANAHAAFNRRELPAAAPDFVDHRPLVTVGAGDPTEKIRGMWEFTPDLTLYIEAVHELTDRGAVLTQASHGTSQAGFEAEWRVLELETVVGNIVNRVELFDEGDIDTALARLDELSAATRFNTTATKSADRFVASFAVRDWDAMADLFDDSYYSDDRRRVVNAGYRRGRDTAVKDLKVASDVGLLTRITSDIIATRGDHLILTRLRAFGRDDPATHLDLIQVVESDVNGRIVAAIVFDPNDLDAAFAELDARYIAGEAANHVHTWSAIVKSYAMFQRGDLALTTQDWVSIDHRLVRTPIDAQNRSAYVRAARDLTPNFTIHIEAVHLLGESGAVITHIAHGTSRDGFDAEWRDVNLLILEGDRISRCELFDESDLAAALARFAELDSTSAKPANAASQAAEQFWTFFVRRDWKAMANVLADDIVTEDRRRVVNTGKHNGREFDLANMRSAADIGVTNVCLTVVATRGDRLALSRVRLAGHDLGPNAFHTEAIGIAETNADGRIVAHLAFDPGDLDAAFAELDARYIAGEGSDHANLWSEITQAYSTLNKREFPQTTTQWVTVDHRVRETFDADDLTAYMRSGWDLTPGVKMYIEAVHRVSDCGAVVTHVAFGTSRDGFDAEWRMIEVLAYGVDGRNRCELFDENDLDAALARFDELGHAESHDD